ncbi:MAG: FAD:protein FMN transferase [Desulfobacterales bacterium]|nr:FAD:protein FMN transferase [Desulfobacterales bacterium]
MKIKSKVLWAAVICLFCLAPVQGRAKQYTLTGQTMGTFYTVKFISQGPVDSHGWQKKIDTRLDEVNQKMSIFRPDSEISKFNASPANQAVRISRDFHHVVKRAQELHQRTQGAWDGTVKPLVDLWGFGTRDRKPALPPAQAVDQALARMGFSHIRIQDQSLTKTRPGITLDLGSIAKGYGVDAIGELLFRGGIKNYLVEIGGELRAHGKNRKGRTWSVGISRPNKKYSQQGIFKVITLDNQSVATSGNYRNFYEKDGKTYSHIIDPRTGYPVENQVVSATVIAPDCTLADGLATALMVMPVDQGLAVVKGMDQVECLIIQKIQGEFVESHSPGFHTR